MLKNCAECGKVFSHPTQTLCAACQHEQAEDFAKVKKYIEKRPKAPLMEVADETEVSIETIYEYIRKGRLQVVPPDVVLECEICGKNIERGKLCHACRTKLKPDPQPQPQPQDEETTQTGRMHILNKMRNRRGN